MAKTARKAVVVGYDLTEPSRRAVRWAAREASSLRRPLLLVHVFTLPFDPQTLVRLPGEGDVLEPVQDVLRYELNKLVEDCWKIDTAIEVRSELPIGDPAEVLADMAEDAEVLVLGGPRIEVELGVLGSTSAELLTRRTGAPVVVVRGEHSEPDGRPVVVGVDGSSASRRAVGFAYDFASRHGCGLVAVHAWSDQPLDPFTRVHKWELPVSEVHNESEEVLARSLAGWGEQYPDVDVRRVVTPEKPVQAMLREADGAGLLVVGSHGRGRIRRSLLGSVSHAVVNRAPCPVAILRAGS